MIGVHGATALAGGEAGFGGGGMVGLDGKPAQGFAEYSAARGNLTWDNFVLGARLKIGKGGAFQPVVGGGWSWSKWTTQASGERRSGTGIGLFGEGGVLYAMANHRFIAVARMTLGLYEPTVDRSYTTSDGTSYPYAAKDGSPWTFGALAGYAYVFR
jgi:hypothetical protein